MELRTLRYFLKVAEKGNITRAAEALYITQPALSRQMTALERELGAQLFAREPQFALTEAGERLKARAQEVMGLVDRIDDEVRGQEDLRGVVAIGSGGLAAFDDCARVISQFRTQHPHVVFELHTNCADRLMERLEEGLLDFALLLGPVDVERFETLAVQTQERWGLCVRRDHPLARQEGVRGTDLASVPLAVSDRLVLQRAFSDWMGTEFASLDVVATFNLIDNVLPLVATGNVCALTTQGSVRFCAPDAYAFVPLEPELTATSVLAWRKEAHLRAASSAFLQQLRSCL